MPHFLKQLTRCGAGVDTRALAPIHKNLLQVAAVHFESKKIRSLREVCHHARELPGPLRRRIEAANTAYGLLRHVSLSALHRLPQRLEESLGGEGCISEVDEDEPRSSSAPDDPSTAERDEPNVVAIPADVHPPSVAAPMGGRTGDPLAGLSDDRVLRVTALAAQRLAPAAAQEEVALERPNGDPPPHSALQERIAALGAQPDAVKTNQVELMRDRSSMTDGRESTMSPS